MKIPSSIDFIDADLSSELEFNESLEFSHHPTHPDALLLESSLIQWVITKYHHTTNPFSIRLTENESTISKLEEIPGSHGKTLALINDAKILSISKSDSENYKKNFFKVQSNWPDLALSDSATLFCLDNRSKSLHQDNLAPQLYTPDEVAGPTSFGHLVEQLCYSVTASNDLRGRIIPKQQELGLILFELFKNTHDHAKLNFKGGEIQSSTRGIYCKFYDADSLIENFKNSKNVPKNYVENYVASFIQNKIFDHSQKQTRSRDISGFLELSVFDSGSGMASKWLKKEAKFINPSEQKSAIIECLKKGKSSLGNNERGYGLWKVLETLKNLQGLIRIRSNNIHAATEFRTTRHPIETSKLLDGRKIPETDLYDWKLMGSTQARKYPEVKGTLVSILLPIGEL